MAVDDVSEVDSHAHDDVDADAHAAVHVDDDAHGVDADVPAIVVIIGQRHDEGRRLVLKGRLKKNWAVHSLPRRSAQAHEKGRGHASAPWAKQLSLHHMVQGHAHLKGVSRLRHVFRPSSQLQKKDLDTQTTALRVAAPGARVSEALHTCCQCC